MNEKPSHIRAYGDTVLDGAIRVIPTPGHTPGHVCLLYGDVLFAGDLVASRKGALRPYPAPWNWDDAAMADSIRKLNALPFRHVCTAHGRPQQRDAWNRMVARLYHL